MYFIFVILSLFFSMDANAMVRASVQAGTDDGYYDGNDVWFVWYGPGYYDGVWFDDPYVYYQWHRHHYYRHHYQRPSRHYHHRRSGRHH